MVVDISMMLPIEPKVVVVQTEVVVVQTGVYIAKVDCIRALEDASWGLHSLECDALQRCMLRDAGDVDSRSIQYIGKG
jgi:hypothetical protein